MYLSQVWHWIRISGCGSLALLEHHIRAKAAVWSFAPLKMGGFTPQPKTAPKVQICTVVEVTDSLKTSYLHKHLA